MSKYVPYALTNKLHLIFGSKAKDFSNSLLELLFEVWESGRKVGAGEACSFCLSEEDVRLESSRTYYSPSKEDPNPNAPLPLCRACAKEHHAHWDDMWNEYSASCY